MPDVDLADEHSRISDVIPLVVNTMGLSKGLGVDLNQRIEYMLEPTDIFDIKGPGSSREKYPIANNNRQSRYAACSNMSIFLSSPRLPLLVTRQQIIEHFPSYRIFMHHSRWTSSQACLIRSLRVLGIPADRSALYSHMKLIVLSLSTRSFLRVPEVKMW
jgi:hypothetical protein